jgi:starch phosphorylase
MSVLERDVVPCYYHRNQKGTCELWLGRVKHALRTLAWRYNSDRMVIDYARRLYVPASRTSTAEMPGPG